MKQKSARFKKVKIILIILFSAILAFLGWNIYQNQYIQVNEITITSDQLPDDFAGYKIAHISDLHNTQFGDDNKDLLSAIKETSPDIIVVTGDIIDSRQTDVQIARNFINSAAECTSPVKTDNRKNRPTMIDTLFYHTGLFLCCPHNLEQFILLPPFLFILLPSV